jgi:HAD superfamily phosphatase (TIGR01668 family)
MKKPFTPDYLLNAYSDLTPHFLQKHDIKALILDIDNTLVPYEVAKPTEELKCWFTSLNEAGIKVSFVSNNDSERVRVFNEELLYFATHKSKKPFTVNMKRALKEMDVTPKETAVMGDQIFTDVLAGNSLGAFTVLVPPIKDKRDPLTRFKRLLERPILKRIKMKGKADE